MKTKKQFVIDCIISTVVILISVIFLIFQINYKFFLGVILVGLNIYILFKCKNNKMLFFSFLILLYFNYSFVITKYSYPTSELLEDLYSQLNKESTMHIGIALQIIFLAIINVFLNNINENTLVKDIQKDFKYRKVLVCFLEITLIGILLYHIINSINRNTTLFEYSIFLFIVALFYGKKDLKHRIFIEFILLLFCIFSLKNGDRVAVLQFLLADFLINYLDVFKKRYIVLVLVVGILIFTFAGLYGDFLVYNGNFEELTLDYFCEQLVFRRGALDTSVSAYFTGVSMIDLIDKYTIKDRLINGIEYLFKYTFIGGISKYETVDSLIKTYQTNSGGGFITCFFYFWFGWLGVILISVYVAYIYIIINCNSFKKYTEYKYLLSVFVVSTMPRWYLYTPTLLIRGILLFSIFYFAIYFFVKKNEELKSYLWGKFKWIIQKFC